jgi:NAD(P)-dependent dehydrogenase (short-subunit alcohol dehydrogenase family)
MAGRFTGKTVLVAGGTGGLGQECRWRSWRSCAGLPDANRKAMPKADFNKWAKPAAIARVILFLSSDEARLIHGAAVPVYGHD